MLRKALFLVGALLFSMPVRAVLLDEPDVVPIGDQAEIHINFTTPITYLRHFPQDIGDTVRIFIDVTDPCEDETIRNQESKSYPANGLVNPFTITFPETIGTDNGNATCAATGKKNINTNETIVLRFESWTQYKVRLGDDNHSIIVTVAMRPGAEVRFERPKLKVPVPPAGATDEQLYKSAKAAMVEGEYDSAVEMLNRLLNMPPNKYSQDGQELIGMARELNRDLVKARIEYELYLKLYPNTDGAKRVEDRLAGLNAGKPTVTASAKPKKKYKEGTDSRTFGSVSQYYYGSRTKTNNNGTAPDTTRTDQSALITSVDLTTKIHHNQYDEKLVIRDQYNHNFPPGQRFGDANRLTSAYWEHEDKETGYMTRLGRQPGNSEGILGRFDGIYGRYTVNPTINVAAVLGVPYNGVHSTIQTNRHFYGSAIEFAQPGSSVSGNVYAIQQVADGLPERRAVGTELRYFKDTTSAFGLLDYDTLYHEVNIALLQANWMGPSEINFNALVDHRKSPILYGETGLRTANSASNVTSVGDLEQFFTRNDIYRNINTITANTDTVLFGATKQITARWQLGGDVRMNRTSATGTIVDNLGVILPGTPGTGNSYTYDAQAIGTSTFFKDDTTILNVSYIDDPLFQGQVFGITNLTTFRTKYRIDTALNLFHSMTNQDVRTIKATPTARVTYAWKDNVSFETELGVEKTWQTDGPNNTKNNSLREFMFFGYRWDF
jgi:hypothetical protein